MKTLLLSLVILLLSFSALAQPPAYVPTNGLVGWWPFSGNANDESGNGNDGTVNGATLTTDRFGTANAAYDFDGVNDFIDISSIAGSIQDSNGFTLNCWFNSGFNTTTTAWDNAIFSANFQSPMDNIFRICLNYSGQVYLGVANSGITYGTGLNDNQWHMLTFTREPGAASQSYYIYLDQTLIGSGSAVIAWETATIFAIGAEHDDGTTNDFYTGLIDDIGIWNEALTECEISDLYTSSSINTVTQTGATLTAEQSGATYQWLDCDNGYAVIATETNQSYTPSNVTGNYAVEVTLNGCVDTSACYHVDYTGIEQLTNIQKELVKIIDFMGRETEFKPNTPLIFIYSDGTRERVMKLEE